MSKSNENYWRERFKELEALTYNKSQEYYDRIIKIFNVTETKIKQILNEFYSRFADLEDISITEAKVILNSEEREAFKISVEEYIKFGEENNRHWNPALNDFLEEASLKYRITRLEAAFYQFAGEIGKLTSQEIGLLYDLLADTYIDRYYRTAFAIFDYFGVGTSFEMIDMNRLEMILDKPWAVDGSNFSSRLWSNQTKLTNTLAQILTSACVRGEGYTETTELLARALGTSKKNAGRLVVTESAYFASRAQQSCFEELGADKFMIVATLDNITDPECQELDGQIHTMDEFEIGVTAPPFHPNCVLPETIIASPDCEALTKSYYSGDVIKITISNGTTLSVTPNHIVLTSRGWVRAKDIVKGDKIVYYSGWDKFIIESNPTENDSIPTIENLFTALIESSGSRSISMPASTVDFKGDVVKDSEIDIVFINSFLRDKFDPSISKFISDSPLIRTSKFSEGLFSGKCSLAQFLVGIGLASDGIMSGSTISSILVRGALTHHELVSLRAPADYDMRLFKSASNNITTDRELFGKSILTHTGIIEASNFVNRQFFSNIGVSDFNPIIDKNFLDSFISASKELSKFADAFTGVIEFNDVVGVDRFRYFGHVYDSSSLSTLNICNGIITSNCRCTTRPCFDDEDVPGYVEGTRTARDPGGRTYRIPRNMYYPEWSKKYGIKPKYGTASNRIESTDSTVPILENGNFRDH